MQYQRAVGIQHLSACRWSPRYKHSDAGECSLTSGQRYAGSAATICSSKQQRVQRGERPLIPRLQQNKMLYRCLLGPRRLNKRQKGIVEKQNLVRGIIDDKREVFRGCAWVDGMASPIPRTDAKIDLQMAAIIPRQRARDRAPVGAPAGSWRKPDAGRYPPPLPSYCTLFPNVRPKQFPYRYDSAACSMSVRSVKS